MRPDRAAAPPSPDASLVAVEAIERRLRDAIGLAREGWRLVDVRLEGDEGLVLGLDGASGGLVLEVEPARPGHPRFVEHEGIAYSHRGQITPAVALKLRSFIGRVHREVLPLLRALAASGPPAVAEVSAAPYATAAQISSEADTRAVRELFEQGYTVFERAHSIEEVDYLRERLMSLYDRIGRPGLSANPPYQPAPNVEVGLPGVHFHRLTTHCPDVAARLYKRHIIDTIRAVLGDDMRLELPSGSLSDASRPFFEWHIHIDGANNAYQYDRRVYRTFQRSERVTVLLYLDDLTEENGRLLVYPRKLTDPTEPPYDIHLRAWPGQVEIGCPRGSVVVLEQCTWHAALQKRSPGLRGFIGSYFAARTAKTSPLTDESLAHWSGDDALFRSIVSRT